MIRHIRAGTFLHSKLSLFLTPPLATVVLLMLRMTQPGPVLATVQQECSPTLARSQVLCGQLLVRIHRAQCQHAGGEAQGGGPVRQAQSRGVPKPETGEATQRGLQLVSCASCMHEHAHGRQTSSQALHSLHLAKRLAND